MDESIVRWFHTWAENSQVIESLASFIAYGLHPWVYRVALVAACVVAYRAGRHKATWVALGAMMSTTVVVWALKLGIDRQRPPVALSNLTSGSMPSSHAAHAVAGGGLIVIVLWPMLQRTRWLRPAMAVAAFLAVLACLDRLVLGVHYPSDVAVGAAIGIIAVLIADRLAPRLRGALAWGYENPRGPDEGPPAPPPPIA